MLEVQLEKVERLAALLNGVDEHDLFKGVEKLCDYYFNKCSLDQALTMLLTDASTFSKAKDAVIKLRDYTVEKMRQYNSFFDDVILKESSDVVGVFIIASAVRNTFEIEKFWNNAPSPDRNDCLCRLTDEFTEKVKALSNSDALKQNFMKRGLILVPVLEEVARHKTFFEKIEKLLNEMPRKIFSFTLMDEVAGTNSFKVEPGAISFSTFCTAADCLVVACVEVDIRVRERYLNAFKRLFFMVADFNAAMRYVYELKHFRESSGNVPDLRNYFKHFDANMTSVLNGLTECNTFSTNPELANITRTLSYLMLISPKPAIRQLLLFFINAKPLWPSAFLILEKITAFFELRVCSIDPNSNKTELLIITLFRRLLNVEKCVRMDNERDRDLFQTLIAHFTRTQFKNNSESGLWEISKRPLFDATDLLRDFVLDNLSSSVEPMFMLSLLSRMLRCSEDRCWVINWGQDDINGKNDGVKINPHTMASLLIDVYVASVDDPSIQCIVLDNIKLFVEKLKADKVVLTTSKNESEFVFEKMTKLDWPLKYCISSWLMSSIQLEHKIEIPNVLYTSLLPKCRENYSPIKSTLDCSETEDFLRCIFELAIFSPDEALSFLQKNEFKFLPTRVYSLMIGDALLRSVRADTTLVLLLKLLPIIDLLFTLLNVPVQSIANYWTEHTFKEAQKLEPIIVAFQALYIYIKESLHDEDLLDVDKISREANVLLEMFIHCASKYTNQKFAALKMVTIIFESDEFGSHSETELLSVLGGFAELFRFVSFLAEKFQPIPTSLRRLKADLAQYSKLLYNKIFPPYCEDISRYSKPSASFTQPPNNTEKSEDAVVSAEAVESKIADECEKPRQKKEFKKRNNTRNKQNGEKVFREKDLPSHANIDVELQKTNDVEKEHNGGEVEESLPVKSCNQQPFKGRKKDNRNTKRSGNDGRGAPFGASNPHQERRLNHRQEQQHREHHQPLSSDFSHHQQQISQNDQHARKAKNFSKFYPNREGFVATSGEYGNPAFLLAHSQPPSQTFHRN